MTEKATQWVAFYCMLNLFLMSVNNAFFNSLELSVSVASISFASTPSNISNTIIGKSFHHGF